jgi:hypothetical protein
MKKLQHLLTLTVALLLALAPLSATAQEAADTTVNGTDKAPAEVVKPAEEAKEAAEARLAPQPANIGLQYYRPVDQRGINVFETPKHTDVRYTGFHLDWGASFAQQMQGLSHENNANMVDGVNANQLEEIGIGFNTASANLYLGAQLADGIRVHLETYLSSKHHPETWVKGGYLQVDQLPFSVPVLDDVMQYLTIRAGHFGVNYGDAHFRRSDNAQTLFNPFVENLILDAFTTEIGMEFTGQYNGFLGVLGVTGGEIQGNVRRPDDRSPSFYGKLGVDRQINEDLRVRLTGSAYHTAKSVSNTLYWGDRAGSRYHSVLTAEGGTNNFAGRTNPVINHNLTAIMVNPFVKFHGLELFGTYERATGQNAAEYTNDLETRTWDQFAIDAVYRFLPQEQLFVAARYNQANGQLVGSRADVSIDRVQAGLGWFVTPNVLVKGEYVQQRYHDFPSTDLRSGGKFNGFMIEGVVSF